ncbi:pistil-specific extensin-like protein [Solanum dulcamara]|uniref:pistil-specific extensin-like protein n=1 Tax=Solanum dulcamara TaxID=45834 RepID=UPI0024868300|nr:pistil-specific extensin-like protein [Solanum dulcamara]
MIVQLLAAIGVGTQAPALVVGVPVPMDLPSQPAPEIQPPPPVIAHPPAVLDGSILVPSHGLYRPVSMTSFQLLAAIGVGTQAPALVVGVPVPMDLPSQPAPEIQPPPPVIAHPPAVLDGMMSLQE